MLLWMKADEWRFKEGNEKKGRERGGTRRSSLQDAFARGVISTTSTSMEGQGREVQNLLLRFALHAPHVKSVCSTQQHTFSPKNIPLAEQGPGPSTSTGQPSSFGGRVCSCNRELFVHFAGLNVRFDRPQECDSVPWLVKRKADLPRLVEHKECRCTFCHDESSPRPFGLFTWTMASVVSCRGHLLHIIHQEVMPMLVKERRVRGMRLSCLCAFIRVCMVAQRMQRDDIFVGWYTTIHPPCRLLSAHELSPTLFSPLIS